MPQKFRCHLEKGDLEVNKHKRANGPGKQGGGQQLHRRGKAEPATRGSDIPPLKSTPRLSHYTAKTSLPDTIF